MGGFLAVDEKPRWFTIESPEIQAIRATARVSRGTPVHPGDVVTINEGLCYVVTRVGYKAETKDYAGEAKAMMNRPEVYAALGAVREATGARYVDDAFQRMLQIGLLRAARFGGAHRGMWCRPGWAEPQTTFVVRSKRVVRLGVYQPSVGGGEDYEPALLVSGLSLVLLDLPGHGEIPAAWTTTVARKTGPADAVRG